MSNLNIQRVDKKDTTRIYFEGCFDETSSLNWGMFKYHKNKVRFNLRGISMINSCGVREWISFISSAPEGIEIEYEQCSVPFTRQLNQIANFLGRGKLKSFHLPFYCDICEVEIEKLMVFDPELGFRKAFEQKVFCPQCNKPLEIDYIPSSILDFRTQHTSPINISRETLLGILKHVFEKSLNATVLVNTEDEVLYGNGSFCLLFKQRLKEMCGTKLSTIHRFFVGGEEQDLLHNLEGRVTTWREVEIPQIPGSNFLIEIVPFPFAKAVLVVYLNLTEEAFLHHRYRELWEKEQQLRLQLADQNINLQQKNKELEVAQTALSQSLAELEKTQASMALSERLAALGQMSAALSHEINNPISSILTCMVELQGQLKSLTGVEADLQRGAPDEFLLDTIRGRNYRAICQEVNTLVEDALIGIRHLAQISADLKMYLSSGDEISDPCDLCQILDGVIRLVGHQFKYEIEFVKDFGKIPYIIGNRSRLAQVFLNLLINAAQAIPPEQDNRRVVITTNTKDNQVLVAITDNGLGMDEDTQKKIFEPFYTKKFWGNGTGLGLSVVLRIVENHGGTVVVKSKLGEGTTFEIYLPTGQEETISSVANKIALPTKLKLPQKRRQILLVDDNELFRKSVSRLISNVYDVEQVGTGSAAVELLRAGRKYDAVVVDLCLPQVSGIALIQQIEAEFSDSVRSICILTAGAYLSHQEEFLATQRYPMLRKPIEPDVLLRALEEMISLGKE